MGRKTRIVWRLWLTLTAIVCLTYATWRCTFYWRIPVCKGEPYGLADVLELFLYVGALATVSVGVLAATIAAIFKPGLRRNALKSVVGLVALLLVSCFAFHHMPCASVYKPLWTCGGK